MAFWLPPFFCNVRVYARPDGDAIGTLSENRRVYIANEGTDGWVPLERPVNGYVNANHLGYCS